MMQKGRGHTAISFASAMIFVAGLVQVGAYLLMESEVRTQFEEIAVASMRFPVMAGFVFNSALALLLYATRKKWVAWLIMARCLIAIPVAVHRLAGLYQRLGGTVEGALGWIPVSTVVGLAFLVVGTGALYLPASQNALRSGRTD